MVTAQQMADSRHFENGFIAIQESSDFNEI